MNSELRIFVAVTGASGAIYAERLVQELLAAGIPRIYLTFSTAGKAVVGHELSKPKTDLPPTEFSLQQAALGIIENPTHRQILRLFNVDDFFAPCASGSSAPTHMVVLPASMGTVARIAQGLSSNLIERTADVMLKQKRPLLVCPRETPFNAIHLRNLLTLAETGAHIVPAMPGFYQNPQTLKDLVDFFVGRVLECLDVPHDLYRRWNRARF